MFKKIFSLALVFLLIFAPMSSYAQEGDSMAYLSVTGKTQTSISVKMNGLTYADGYTFYFYGAGLTPVPSGSSSRTYSGLSCGNNYTLSCDAYHAASGTSVSDDIATYTLACDPPPDPDPPSAPTSITISDLWRYSFSLQWSGGGPYWHLQVYRGTTANMITESTNNYNGIRSISGLSPDTQYTIRVRSYDPGTGLYSSYRYEYVTTLEEPNVRPTNFSGWGITVASGQPCAITANKWNEFTSKILEFRIYKNVGHYSFTTAVSGNDITATMANQLILSLTGIATGLPAQVASGADFTAAWLNAVTNALNGIA